MALIYIKFNNIYKSEKKEFLKSGENKVEKL